MWSSDDLAIVAKGAELGLRASQIAAQVGRTRNAVVGIINRRGFAWNYSTLDAKRIRAAGPTGRRPPGPKKLDARLHALATPGVMDARLQEKIARRLAEDPPPIVHEEGPVTEQTESGEVPLTELRRHHCRYPIGDPTTPQFRYCGMTRVEGKSYCPDHERLCHTRLPRRW